MRHWRSVSGAHGCSAPPPSLKGGKCKVEESRGWGCKVGGREGGRGGGRGGLSLIHLI